MPFFIDEYADHLVAEYEEMRNRVSIERMTNMFLGAKASLLGENSLSVTLRRSMLESYRRAEVRLFGKISELPFEQELLKEPLSESVASDQKLEKIASDLAGAILASSISCAQRIEESFRTSAPKPLRFEDRDFQDVVAEFVYVFMDLSVREAFEKRLGPEQRSAFLNSLHSYLLQLGKKNHMTEDHPVPTFTRREEKPDPRITVVTEGMDLLNERHAEYSRLNLFAAPNEPQLTGTLFGEFGNHVAKICDRYHHDSFIQMEAKILASEEYLKLIPRFSGLIQAPKSKRRTGFWDRLLGEH